MFNVASSTKILENLQKRKMRTIAHTQHKRKLNGTQRNSMELNGTQRNGPWMKGSSRELSLNGTFFFFLKLKQLAPYREFQFSNKKREQKSPTAQQSQALESMWDMSILPAGHLSVDPPSPRSTAAIQCPRGPAMQLPGLWNWHHGAPRREWVTMTTPSNKDTHWTLDLLGQFKQTSTKTFKD